MIKKYYIEEPIRGKLRAAMITVAAMLPASLLPGVIVGLAFRCSLPTFYICMWVISPLVLMVLCMWATHLRLYRGARSGMAIWPLLKYAVQSDEYRKFGCCCCSARNDDLFNYYRYYDNRYHN